MMDIDLEIVCMIVYTMDNGSIPDLTSEPSASRTESVETVVSDVYDVATIALVRRHRMIPGSFEYINEFSSERTI